MNNFKTFIIIALAILAISLFTCNGCLKAKLAECEGKQLQPVTNTVIKTDTFYQHSTDTFTKTELMPYAVIRYRVDSFTAFEKVPVDTAAILQDFFSKAYYSQPYVTQYGKIIINDTVTQNRIAGRSVITDFTIPVITKTITNTIQAKKKVKGFLVASLTGSFEKPLQQIGGGFMLQFKNDNSVEAQIKFDKTIWNGIKQQPFEVSYKQKISLK